MINDTRKNNTRKNDTRNAQQHFDVDKKIASYCQKVILESKDTTTTQTTHHND